MRLLVLLLTFIASATFAQDTTKMMMPGYMGVYKGKLPCESCSFIESELTLEYDTDTSGLFSLRDKYVNEKAPAMLSVVKGDYVVNRAVLEGKPVLILELNRDNTDAAIYYLAKTKTELIPLSREMQYMDLPKDFVLRKVQ